MSEFKTRWLAALRSGHYPQTKRRLYRTRKMDKHLAHATYPDGYCCLGVAAEVMGDLDKTTGQVKSGSYATYMGPNNELFPNSLAEACTYANDEEGWTFNQIADWLEGIDF